MIMIEGYHVQVTLTPELRLEEALKMEFQRSIIKDPAMITSITVYGTFTDEDYEYMNKNLNKCFQADFSNCTTLPLRLQQMFSSDGLKESGFVTIQEYAKINKQ